MKERAKIIKIDNKLLKVLQWTGAFLLLVFVFLHLDYHMDDDKNHGMYVIRNESLYRNLFEKHVGEIEFLESKLESTYKNVYFRVKEYPKSIYSYTLDDKDVRYSLVSSDYRNQLVQRYYRTINRIKMNELYYDEIEILLEDYFKGQQTVFHFSCGLNHLDYNHKEKGILDIDRKMIEEMCMSESNGVYFSVSVSAVFPSDSSIDLNEMSRDLYLYLRDEYEELHVDVTVHLAKTDDIQFFEDQNMFEYYSRSDKRLSDQDACVNTKMDVQFDRNSYPACSNASTMTSEEIMKELVKKYEEFYRYHFDMMDYSCSSNNGKTSCSYTVERVKNGLIYEGILEYEDCDSIKDHIKLNQRAFKKQMKIK